MTGTKPLSIILNSGPAPVEVQDRDRWLLALLSGNGGGLDANGNPLGIVTVPASAASASRYNGTALEASHVIKGSAGTLYGVSAYNASDVAQYLLVMNSATLPANGAVSLLCQCIPLPARTLVAVEFSKPIAASAGITVCNSTTDGFTKTIGSANCHFGADYT